MASLENANYSHVAGLKNVVLVFMSRVDQSR